MRNAFEAPYPPRFVGSPPPIFRENRAISEARASTADGDAAAVAAAKVAAVRDDPRERLAFASGRTTRASSPPISTIAISPRRRAGYAVIQPRLRLFFDLCDWSARELERPELAALVIDDVPAYTWSPDERPHFFLTRSSHRMGLCQSGIRAPALERLSKAPSAAG
jgi:hypothetical protein